MSDSNMRAAIQAALDWLEDGTPTSERSTEENAVIDDLRRAIGLEPIKETRT
jgi:hypothetical protein